MPSTALNHFNQDIDRAKVLKDHADSLLASTLKDDIYRASWMIAIGALDAYFCDAFADILSKILIAKSIDNRVQLSPRVKSLKLPINSIVNAQNTTSNWKWRNAARDLIEKDNVLSIDKIKELFNHIMDEKNKILSKSMMEDWLINKSAKHRLMGISPTDYKKLSNSDKEKKRKSMLEKLSNRYTSLIQRRHDCIHNCDRPKVSLTKISSTDVLKVIEDINFLITTLDGHIDKNLRRHLLSIGCNKTLVRRVKA
jgi:DNA-binding ferritin-like protein